MNLLLDTHTLIWYYEDSDRMPASAKNTIDDGQNNIFMSAASAWEIAIKVKIGKLLLKDPLERMVAFWTANGTNILPIQLEHAMLAGALPLHHRDPFDRMLIAQAIHEDLTLVTCDPVFEQYEIPRLW